MPTYDYECDACGHEFELFQSIIEPVQKKCPKCGKLKLRRLFGTGAAVVFKGSGFYQTDYRSESYKKGAEKDKPASESKSESKSIRNRNPSQNRRAKERIKALDRIEIGFEEQQQEREEKISQVEIASPMRGFSDYKTSAYVLIAANALPLFGVLFLGWDTFSIVALYWVENVIIGAINVLKMITCNPDLDEHRLVAI